MPIRRNMYTGRRRLYESLPPILRPPASQSDTSHGITNIQAAKCRERWRYRSRPSAHLRDFNGTN